MRFDISYLGNNNVVWGKNHRTGPAIKLLGTDGVCVCIYIYIYICVCMCVCVCIYVCVRVCVQFNNFLGFRSRVAEVSVLL
jgi:hypothetical protein